MESLHGIKVEAKLKAKKLRIGEHKRINETAFKGYPGLTHTAKQIAIEIDRRAGLYMGSTEMKVLVACEYSQVVTKAFRDRGITAFSCDVLPTEGNKDWHIQDDVLNHLNDGWDLMVAHPPCTFMCNSGVCHLSKDESRWGELQKANEFFHKLWNAPIRYIAIENPIPHKYALLPKYTQIIQPYQFGHAERKATCLWLKNLPPLKPTNDVYDIMKSLPKNQAQRIHYTSPGKDRWKIRSKTFQGIADAIADQWSRLRLAYACSEM